MNNQYVVIAPDSLTAMEWVSFSSSHDVVYSPPGTIWMGGGSPPPYNPADPNSIRYFDPYNYELHDVVLDSSIPSWCSVSWAKTGQMRFSLSGTFDDVFLRTVSYVQDDNSKNTVQMFHNVPSDFAGLYKYTGHQIPEIIYHFTVRLRPLGYTEENKWTVPQTDLHTYGMNIIVKPNWQVANQKFTELVNSGKYVKAAAEKGLV